QLHAFERAQAELLDRRRRREIATARIFRDERRQRIARRPRRPRRRAGPRPFGARRALQLACAVGARKLALGPDERAPNLLLTLEPRFRPPRDIVRIYARIDDEHGVDTLLTARGDA